MNADIVLIKHYLDQALTGLSAPLYYINDPSSRVYWGFLLSSVGLIMLSFFLRDKGLRVRKVMRAVFSPHYWFNRSTATDVFYLGLSSVLRALLLIPLVGSHLWATIIVARFFQANLGNSPDVVWPLWLIMACYTLVFFIVEDLSRFLLHVAMHKLPFLWHFHRVHHSATVLTPLTVYRVHPLEMTLYFLRSTAVFGLVSGLFVYLFGAKLGGFQILGVDALGFIFCALGANLRHSHIWLGFGKFERWFISPAQHQMHHSKREQHKDINFGTCLACWDRVMGSLVLSPKRRRFAFGLSEPSAAKRRTRIEGVSSLSGAKIF